MTLQLHRGEWFKQDFERQAAWYLSHADDIVAQGYLDRLDETLQLLVVHPGIGRGRKYRHPELKGLHSFRVNPPFQRHLIFYRHDSPTLYAVRVIHGARDLARRLREPPGGGDE